MRHPTGSALAWLVHPATVTATFLLLVNDHLLKALWPGPITGKLSDFAGLMVAPPLLALARVPPPAALAVTGLGFVLVKTTQTGADLASQAWTLLAGPSLVLADPTDLIALPALAAAWAVHRRSRTEHAVRQARTLVIVPVALIAVTATGQADMPQQAHTVFSDGETITVLSDHGYGNGPVVSRDGGRTWVKPAPPAPAPGSVPTPSGRPSPVTRSCVPGDPAHCYRVVPPRLAVDESRDGGRTWTTVWGVSKGREELLERTVTEHLGPGAWQGSQAIVVHPVAGGHVVVAANGSDGIAVRDADGAWRRFGFSAGGFSAEGAAPLDSANVNLTAEYVMGSFAGLFVFLAGVATARRGGLDEDGPAATAYVLAAVGFFVAAMGVSDDGFLSPLFVAAGIGCAVASLVNAAIALLPAGRPAWTWTCLITVSALTVLVICAVFDGWVAGTPDRYSTAVLISWLTAITGAAASVLIAWKGGRRPVREEGDPPEGGDRSRKGGEDPAEPDPHR
ncbi:hypothetical protein PS9374_04691 [Planomonospora sphaerica]|uniref:Uncharacterized protein n=1 Tax=Planomonospora sphaerica TaxID=161355 RepID=A0A161LN70_9ACTN|nr:hypothetical protein [Planomonospora sphaerica]GAT69025.1 hypothetical protein PS9374_04691 [Planomonospora sphaerica]